MDQSCCSCCCWWRRRRAAGGPRGALSGWGFFTGAEISDICRGSTSIHHLYHYPQTLWLTRKYIYILGGGGGVGGGGGGGGGALVEDLIMGGNFV